MSDLIERGLAIIALLAMAGCAEPTTWECRTPEGRTVVIHKRTNHTPARHGGVDTNGWEWEPEQLPACRALKARP